MSKTRISDIKYIIETMTEPDSLPSSPEPEPLKETPFADSPIDSPIDSPGRTPVAQSSPSRQRRDVNEPASPPLSPPPAGTSDSVIQSPPLNNTPGSNIQSPPVNDTPNSNIQSPPVNDTPNSNIQSPPVNDTPNSNIQSPPKPGFTRDPRDPKITVQQGTMVQPPPVIERPVPSSIFDFISNNKQPIVIGLAILLLFRLFT